VATAVNDDHNHLVAAIMEAQNFILFFVGGFVFVAATTVAQTQHTDGCNNYGGAKLPSFFLFFGGFVFVATTTVA
jgi:hypothetical protein